MFKSKSLRFWKELCFWEKKNLNVELQKKKPSLPTRKKRLKILLYLKENIKVPKTEVNLFFKTKNDLYTPKERIQSSVP